MLKLKGENEETAACLLLHARRALPTSLFGKAEMTIWYEYLF